MTKPDPEIRFEKGSAMVTAILFMLIASVLMVVGSKLVVESYKSTKKQETSIAEADNVARAGLIDALNWFRNQGVVSNPEYPSEAFHPLQNNTHPELGDTLDEGIGLVKEYNLGEPVTQGSVVYQRVGRYEIRRQTRWAGPTPTGTITPVPVPTPDFMAVQDMSPSRRLVAGTYAGQGSYWRIPCTGYIYRKIVIPAAGAGTPTPVPEIIDKAVVAMDITRINIQITPCAVFVRDCGSRGVTVATRGDLYGEKGSVAH